MTNLQGLAAVLIGRRSVVRSRAFSAEQFLRETAPPLDGLSYTGQGGRVTELKNPIYPYQHGPNMAASSQTVALLLELACFVSSFPFYLDLLSLIIFDLSTWAETQRSAAAGVEHAGIL